MHDFSRLFFPSPGILLPQSSPTPRSVTEIWMGFLERVLHLCQLLAAGNEVAVNRRKRKRVLDNSRAAPPPGADPANSTNQIPVMVRTVRLFAAYFRASR